MDSFDGRKDPERCASLVNKLRSCQDKLLSICNKMLEEVEPGYSGRLREHRAKFPGKNLTISYILKIVYQIFNTILSSIVVKLFIFLPIEQNKIKIQKLFWVLKRE